MYLLSTMELVHMKTRASSHPRVLLPCWPLSVILAVYFCDMLTLVSLDLSISDTIWWLPVITDEALALL